MSVTEFQKQLYNEHLRASRTSKGEPWKARVNFDDLDTEKINDLILIENNVKKNPYMNLRLFFSAPFKLHPNERHFPLSFFKSQHALKTYVMYMNILQQQDPDSPDQLAFMRNSMAFIRNFCIEKRIPLSAYLFYKEKVTNSWCSHFISQNISIYALLGLSFAKQNIYFALNSIPEDERQLFMGDYFENLNDFMSKLNNSKLAKLLAVKGYKMVEDAINSSLSVAP